MKAISDMHGESLMRWLICSISLLWGTSAFAQPERYELGKKVHDLELTWELNPPSMEAKQRATPLINQAVQSFFRFNMSAAAKNLDEARHALRSATAPSAAVRWADAISIQPEVRVIDSTVAEWLINVKQFYKPDGSAPEKASARIIVGKAPPQEFPLEKLPSQIKYSLKDFPGPATADLPVSVAIIAGGQVLGLKTLSLTRIENLEKRLDKLQMAVDATKPPLKIEQATLAHLAKLLKELTQPKTPETDYPAARLLLEAEQLLVAKDPYYTVSHSGEHWLALPTPKATSVVRVRIPEHLNKDKPVPIVIALHGMGGSENMYFDAYGNGIVPRLAHDRGWIVVAPRVTGILGAGAAPDVPAILDQLAERYPIDRKRVFLVGHSMGAGHSMLLSQQTPEQFTGVAALGGGGKVGKPEVLKSLPFFIGVGKQDFALRGAKLMYDSLQTVKAPAIWKEYDDIEHLAIVQEAAPDVFQFFDSLAGKK